MLKTVTKFLKAASALVFAAGILSGCAGKLSGSDFSGTSERAAAAVTEVRATAKKLTETNDRFQIRLALEKQTSISSISFAIRPSSYSAYSAITVRDGAGSNEKWLKGVSFSSLKTEKINGDTWYLVDTSFSSAKSTSKIGITVDGAAKEGSKLYIANFKINGSVVDFSKNKWEVWYQPEEVTFEQASTYNKESGGDNPGNTSDDEKLRTKSEVKSNPISGIDFLMAGPGNDTTSSVTLSWQAPMPYCKLEYTPKDGSTKTVLCKGELSDKLNWESDKNFYNYKVDVEGLSKNTEYSYKVSCYINGTLTSSKTQKFRTSNGSGDFKFLVVSDLHAGK
ncbi:MAG: fibronectin type III domain-containing protein, partial [Treponema sp.]|nr:fibronectin type III domain-containing protein [Treponema sp.]